MVCSRLLWCIAVGAVCAPGAHAQSGGTGYPEKPIRMVVPFAAGGALDMVGRIVGQKMTQADREPANQGGMSVTAVSLPRARMTTWLET